MGTALTAGAGAAYRTAMLAATQARERFSHADAAALYRRAIDAGRQPGMVNAAGRRRLAYAWEGHGDALRRVGEPAAARRALREARRLFGTPSSRRLHYLHAEVAHETTTG